MTMMPPHSILPSTAFDCDDTTTAAPDVQTWMGNLLAEAKDGGLDIKALCGEVKGVTADNAPALMHQLHNAATVLFLHWTQLLREEESMGALATARLFNSMTRDARTLQDKFQLIDISHLDKLKADIEALTFGDDFNPTAIAELMGVAAKEHTHERAWPWTILPTFARQPYGRIMLFKAEIAGFQHPIFVTQPFFLEGRATLFHTHGQNWAYSAPLGEKTNTHINTLWTPRESDAPFPLNLEDNAEYCCGDVAIVPPRLIHGIARKRMLGFEAIPCFQELVYDPERCQRDPFPYRFGEQACLHVYCPDVSLSHQLANSPFLQEDDKFFLEYDMIVFDHQQESIWSGAGGSWPRRMIEFGATGDHCGICFEDDPRKENLDPATVSQWFVASPAPSLIKFRG